MVETTFLDTLSASRILETAIGLIFVFLAVSLLVTWIDEFIAAIFSLRAKHMFDVVQALLNPEQDATTFWQQFKINTGRVRNIYNLKLQGVEDPLHRFYESGFIASLRQKADKFPSYIDPRDFADFLMGLFLKAGIPHDRVDLIRTEVKKVTLDSLKKNKVWGTRKNSSSTTARLVPRDQVAVNDQKLKAELIKLLIKINTQSAADAARAADAQDIGAVKNTTTDLLMIDVKTALDTINVDKVVSYVLDAADSESELRHYLTGLLNMTFVNQRLVHSHLDISQLKTFLQEMGQNGERTDRPPIDLNPGGNPTADLPPLDSKSIRSKHRDLKKYWIEHQADLVAYFLEIFRPGVAATVTRRVDQVFGEENLNKLKKPIVDGNENVFWNALMDTCRLVYSPDNQIELTLASMEASVDQIQNNYVKNALKDRIRLAWQANQTLEQKVEGIRSSLILYFNTTMDRADGWYKRRIQTISFFVALVLVLLLNIDAFAVSRTLYFDNDLRAFMVAEAEKAIEANIRELPGACNELVGGELQACILAANDIVGSASLPEPCAGQEGEELYLCILAENGKTIDERSERCLDQTGENLQACLNTPAACEDKEGDALSFCLIDNQADAFIQSMADQGLPIFWIRPEAAERQTILEDGDGAAATLQVPYNPNWPPNFTQWIFKIAGLVATAFAVSFGAPFWHDLLGKLVNMRLTGKKPNVELE